MGNLKQRNNPGFWGKMRKFWHFIWNDDSLLSWILSIVIAFLVIKFLIYPSLGFVLNTDYPIVAVVSGSMEHKFAVSETSVPTLCGKFGDSKKVSLDDYWNYCGFWYENISITLDEFEKFPFKNGFNTGDIIVIRNPGVENIKVGDVIVFVQPKNPQLEPIIHRVVKVTQKDGTYVFQTKGDHNINSIFIDNQYKYLNEYEVMGDQVIGKGIFRIPYLGYVKIYAYKIFLKIRSVI